MCGHDLPGCLFSMKLDSGTPKIKKNVFLRVFCGVEYSTGLFRGALWQKLAFLDEKCCF